MSTSTGFVQRKFVALVREFSELTGKHIPIKRDGSGAHYLGDDGMRFLANTVEGLRSFQAQHPGFKELPNNSIPINSITHGLEIINQIDNHNLSPDYAQMKPDELQAAIDAYMHSPGEMYLHPKRAEFKDQSERQVKIDYGIRFNHGNMTLQIETKLQEAGKADQVRTYSDGADLPQDMTISQFESKVFAEFKFVPVETPPEVVEPLTAAARRTLAPDTLAQSRESSHKPVTAKLDALLQSMGAFTPENKGIDQTTSRFTPSHTASVSLVAPR
ncbi:hypothetical protein ACPWR0_20250 [Pandoraea pneumonica]|uniref:hypothetical protein n=1 Tax=Pandoraea pneumonica TaxID=2508299 RepID=UPI003CF67924